jgi:hypothetical protein
MDILLFIFGIIALTKGEFKITSNRKVSGPTGRKLGMLMLAGALLPLLLINLPYRCFIPLGTLILVVIIGLANAEEIERSNKPEVNLHKIETPKSSATKANKFPTCAECLCKNPEGATTCIYCGHDLASPRLGTNSVERSKVEPSPKEVKLTPDEQDDGEAKSQQGEVSNELQQAITLIKSGDKQNGQLLLAKILKAEPRNETAWLWMSSVVANDEQRCYCLKQVLTINPSNRLAKKGLAQLEQKGHIIPTKSCKPKSQLTKKQ